MNADRIQRLYLTLLIIECLALQNQAVLSKKRTFFIIDTVGMNIGLLYSQLPGLIDKCAAADIQQPQLQLPASIVQTILRA